MRRLARFWLWVTCLHKKLFKSFKINSVELISIQLRLQPSAVEAKHLSDRSHKMIFGQCERMSLTIILSIIENKMVNYMLETL